MSKCFLPLLLLVTWSRLTYGGPDGFKLLFTSSRSEYQDLAVKLDHPLPSWLHGLYIRNGFGQFEMGDQNFTHAFDGFAKLHSFRFLPDQDFLLFSSHFLRSGFYLDSLRQDKVAPYLLFDAANPPFNLLEKAAALYNGIDNTNINIFQFGGGEDEVGGFGAVSDFWHTYNFDPDTLHTIKRVDPELPTGTGITKMFPIPSSAHPIQEPGTSNYINFYSLLNPLPLAENSINVMRMHSLTKRELIASIPREQIPYMHSFGMTSHFAIILAHPVFIEISALLKSGRPLDSLAFHPELHTDVYVVSLDTGKVQHFTCPPYFFMHHINSFEEDHTIFVDMVTYTHLGLLHSLELANLRKPNPQLLPNSSPDIKRVAIDLHSGQVTVSSFPVKPEMVVVNKLDMPVINPSYAQRQYCIVYGLVIVAVKLNITNTVLVKKNLCANGEKDLVWGKQNHFPTEPWFQPNPYGKAEDDGIVMSLVLDGQSGLSYMVFLDGETFSPMSTAYLPTWVPFTLHGRFFENSSEKTFRRHRSHKALHKGQYL